MKTDPHTKTQSHEGNPSQRSAPNIPLSVFSVRSVVNPSGLPQLQDAISRLVEAYRPQAIWLFGSQARSVTSLPATILSEGILVYAA